MMYKVMIFGFRKFMALRGLEGGKTFGGNQGISLVTVILAGVNG